MNRMLTFASITCLTLAGLSSPLAAQIRVSPGTAFTYQGRVRNAGVTLNGTHSFVVNLYSVASGGSSIGTTNTFSSVTVTNGLFSLTLDFGSVWDGSTRYLGIAVDGGSELTPRTQILPSPFSIYAGNADTLDGIDSTGFSLVGHTHVHSTLTGLGADDHTQYALLLGRAGGQTVNGGTGISDSLTLNSTTNASKGNVLINPTGGKVAVNAAAPGASDTMTVAGTTTNTMSVSNTTGTSAINASATAAGSQTIFSASSSSTGTGVYGQASSATTGSTGVGVLGESLSTNTGSNYYGVRGNATGSTGGRGVGGFGGPGTGVYGNATTSGTGVLGDVSSSTAIAIIGQNTSSSATNNAVGVKGTSGGGIGRAVWGAHSGTGAGFGVYGESSSTSGIGIFGTSVGTNANGGAAILGSNTASSGTVIGVQGQTTLSSNGIGVFGTGAANGVQGSASSATGLGVFGVNASTANPASQTFVTGVWGQSAANTGANALDVGTEGIGNFRGVEGDSNTTTGTGVAGFGGTVGVQGIPSSSVASGWGVNGQTGSVGSTLISTAALGVRGIVTSTAVDSNFRVGVYGETSELTSANHYAGYFVGKVNVTGTLSKGGGSFKIDHPLDPENKYLYHSFVESPDMKNIYDGIAILDGQGKANIQLPDWFGALNRDFRYQLTCIGGYAQIYISQEVKDNTFQIAGGQPGMKVSWQVTGIRQDNFANKNRIPVEEAKQPGEKGLYMYPEAAGQPPEKGINFVRPADKAAHARDVIAVPAAQQPARVNQLIDANNTSAAAASR